jgi:hypothetical protein
VRRVPSVDDGVPFGVVFRSHDWRLSRWVATP